MRALPLLLLLLSACAHTALRTDDASYSTRDYLATALETLTESDPDVQGLRVQAQRETKAALEQLMDGATSHRRVPYDGPPRLEVALELLERSEGALTKTGDAEALEHTRRAAQTLRLALAPR